MSYTKNISDPDVQISHSPRVALLGLERRAEKTLTKELGDAYGKQCHIVDINDAEVVLLDIKETSDIHLIDEFQSNFPNKHCIAMVDRNINVNGYTHISKPILLDVLMKTIRNVSSANTEKFPIEEPGIPHAADVLDKKVSGKGYTRKNNSPRSNNSDHIWENYDPGNYLVGNLLQLADKKNIKNDYTRITFSSNKVVIYDHNKKCILTDASDKQLFFIGSLEKVMGNRVYHENIKRQEVDLLTIKHGLVEKSLEQALWITALSAANGRLPIGESSEQYIYLRRWPNLTRLLGTDNSMRISSLLMKGPRSMQSIVQDLGISEKCLCNYYACTSAIGLSGTMDYSPDNILATIPPKKHQKHSLLRSILKKLS